MAADGNYVEITVSAKDDTGPGFAKADAQTAAFSKVVDQTLRKEISAHNAVTQAETQHAKATDLLAEAERVLAGESGSAAGKLDEVGASSRAAERDVSLLAGAGGGAGMGGMGALIGAGVALSPILFTVGAGLGGLGIAAAGVLDPIKKAATSAGGLQANLGKLDPEQQAAARSLLGLGKEYSAFQQALKPQVLGAWNEAMRIGGHLLGDIEPVAKAAGNAFDGALGQIDKEFQSGTWQKFFGWMAAQAGPDVKQLGDLFTGVAQDIPPLVEGLQPLAQGLVGVATDATRVFGALNDVHLALPLAGAAAGAFVAGPIGALVGGLIGASGELSKLHTAVDATIPSWTRSGQATTAAVTALRAYGPQVTSYIEWLHKSDQAGKNTAEVQAEFAHRANQAGFAAQQEAQKLSTLTSAFTKGLSPLQAYIGATITQASDAHSLEQALKASGDRIGYNTDKQRASFSAAQTYIGDLTTTASAAVASHQGIDKQIASIENALPVLEAVKGKTAGYNAELGQLKSYLDQLAAMKTITEYVNVVTRDVRPGGMQEFHAAGGVVSGAAAGGVRGRRVIVGENGPEAVDLPSGSMVHSNPDTRAMLSGASGGAVVLEFHIPRGGLMLGQDFWTAFVEGIRTRGGSRDIVTKKVIFA